MTNAPMLRTPAEADDCYAFLEWQSNEVTRSWSALPGLSHPFPTICHPLNGKASRPATPRSRNGNRLRSSSLAPA